VFSPEGLGEPGRTAEAVLGGDPDQGFRDKRSAPILAKENSVR